MSKKVEYRYVGTEKMDLLEKASWIKALLDGSHKQGRHSLCHIPTGRSGGPREPRFCCLGVKADIDGVDWDESVTWDARENSKKTQRVFEPRSTDEAYMYYDIGVKDSLDAVEYHSVDGDVFNLSVAGALASMNDHKWSFKRIAAWIDANL